MNPAQRGALPPGRTGLPGLGETLNFIKDPYAFVRARAKEHGPIFRTSLFGNKTAVFLGSEAAARFIDPALVERHGSQPAPVFRLFAGPSVPHLDGEAHRQRKSILLQAFTRDALTAYLPRTRALVDRAFERWTAKPEVRLVDETKRLALQAVAQDVMGITSADDLARLDAWYQAVGAAFTGLPVAIPGTKYATGLRAVDGVLAFFRDVVRAHRASPGDDGLSRILAFRTPEGTTIDDDDAARELHHLVLAGRVVYAHLVTAAIEIARRPDLRERLHAEIADHLQGSEITVERLHSMKALSEFVLEVKRTSPVIPGMFGRAKVDITIGGYTIPRGWMLMFGLREALVDGHTFAHPERFDPDRFAEPRAEHARTDHALVPHGPGEPATSHHCAGTDYATQLAKLFIVTMVRGHTIALPEQRLDYDWAHLTPDPRDGLRATVARA